MTTTMSHGVFVATVESTEEARRAHELGKYCEVIALSGQGYDIASVTRLTGVRKGKVRAWLANWADLCRGGDP